MLAAVRAGYRVIAIDAFADKQTVALAENAMTVNFDLHGFNAESLLNAIGKLDATQLAGFVFGSGFDAQPELLLKIANVIPLIGNTPDVVRAVKTASVFFDGLMQCNIDYPKTCSAHPANDSGTYLQKFAGGCGGTHIHWASDEGESNNGALEANHYYQQHVIGRSISLLFIATASEITGSEVEVVGFNEQWLSPTTNMPFRYGGAVSRIELTQTVQEQLKDAAKKLTKKFGLRGLNSLDAIVQDDVVYVLEINPRLSATVDLYEDEKLFSRHVQACLQSLELQNNKRLQVLAIAAVKAKAHCIVYATAVSKIPSRFEWPSWALDIPQVASCVIPLGEPICTVIAYADFAEDAKQLVNNRVLVIEQLLQKK